MNRRLLNAALLPLLPALTLAVCKLPPSDGAADPRPSRPRLIVWGRNGCGNCRAFSHDFHTDPEFAAAIRERFDVLWVDTSQPRHALDIIAHGIRVVPTFERTDQPSRVENYPGKARLLRALEIEPALEGAPSTPADQDAPPGPTMQAPTATNGEAVPPHAVELQQVRDMLARLADSIDGQRVTAEQLRVAIAEALHRQQLDVAQVRELLNSHNPNGDQLAAILAALRDVQQQTAAPPVKAPAHPLDNGTLQADAGIREPAARPLFRIFGYAVHALELASTLGLIFASGGTAAAVVSITRAALGSMRRRRQRRRADLTPDVDRPSPPPARPAADLPFNPSAFAPYPVDRISRAYNYAREELAKRYPGQVATLETLDSLMRQHLAGDLAAQTINPR